MNALSPLPWHQDQWARLTAARREGRLPHAILLRGPDGLGKGAFAWRVAAALVCIEPQAGGEACGVCAACLQRRAGSHPDLHRLEPEGPGRPIKIDAIRALTAKSVLAAQPAGFRVFVIDPADAMNRPAANALLKTLEEPTSRTVLVLVSDHPDRLPGTIRSRCQALSFRPPPPAVARDWLRQQMPEEGDDRLDALLAIAGGAPLRALKAREEDWDAEGRRLLDELGQLRRREINPFQVVEKWEERSLTTITAGLKRVFSDLVRGASGVSQTRVYHRASRPELQRLADGIDCRTLFRFVDELSETERSTSNNANPQMAIEHLVNRWLELTRRGGR